MDLELWDYLGRVGKTCIIGKFFWIDLVICSSREGKNRSNSRINMVPAV